MRDESIYATIAALLVALGVAGYRWGQSRAGAELDASDVSRDSIYQIARKCGLPLAAVSAFAFLVAMIARGC